MVRRESSGKCESCESSGSKFFFLITPRLYQAEGKVTPEIAAVYEFMASIVGADCAGDKELTFLALRVCITVHNPAFTTFCFSE